MSRFSKYKANLRHQLLGGSRPGDCDSVALSLQEIAPNKSSDMNTGNKKKTKFQHLGDCLARKGGRIYARVELNGKRSWRSTKTNKLSQAQRWLERWKSEAWNERHGIEAATGTLKQKRVPVSLLISEYIAAGHPIIRKRSLKPKAGVSIMNEKFALKPISEYFWKFDATQLSLADCDRYFQWRISGGFVTSSIVKGQTKTRRTKGGTRSVDLELTTLSNVINLAVRRGLLRSNPLRDRGRYTDKDQVRHCREVAPTPEELKQIVAWLAENEHQQYADFTLFLAYSGLRVGEGRIITWGQVNWAEALIHVKRSKKGLIPFVPILPEMQELLENLKQKAADNRLIFPGPLVPNQPIDYSAYRRYLARACVKLGIRHVTPHGLRSYFVTQARQSGLTDAEIAQLIGDKTGPSIIEQIYGDVRPDHLLAIARKIQLTAKTRVAQPH